jgi:hypothetical protein
MPRRGNPPMCGINPAAGRASGTGEILQRNIVGSLSSREPWNEGCWIDRAAPIWRCRAALRPVWFSRSNFK